METDSRQSRQPEDISVYSGKAAYPPALPITPYTPSYCEENVYLLAQKFLGDPDVMRDWQMFAVFISNHTKTVALWNQRLAQQPHFPVVWDYHVVLLLRPHEQNLSQLDESHPTTDGITMSSQFRQSWIYDFDTQLEIPCTLEDYLEGSFMDVPPQFESLFRVVPGEVYLTHFASDRSHMLRLVDAGDSTSESGQVYISPPPSPPYQNHHNEEIVSHLYHSGFQTGNYADTLLHVHQNVYRLHAIILSRSPYLAHLMSTSPQAGGQRVIYVHLDQEPEVTEEGFAIALGYLYSAVSLNMIRPHNARAVLAAGCLLGGMEDLCRYSYEACRQSISVDTIGRWVEFIDTIPSSTDGSTTPDVPKTSIFGLYGQRLKDDVYHFLVDTLPEILEVQQPPSQSSSSGRHGRDILLQIYSRVPFEMFKTAVESPSFRVDPTGSDQARFKFAKEAIELRKRGIARGSGAEETVVLAFGGGNGLGNSVHITRKMRKRPLWKVNA
ncbi:putative btb poz domain-containing protein [Lyophyllum shimeji]|uniref:Protein N-terminal glutamine amidohydrolase n=1 Tax=Lyophyllum shimeji TaxID=47721 RepID=A0A9P3PGA1_LYOSH|nr:putative btb poz domain-containing protein [Lyophyllum shimeji]